MTTKQKLRAAEAKMRRLSAEIGRLYSKLMKDESIAFAKKHSICWSDIEFSEGPGKPRFSQWTEFSNWINHNACTKKWVEWNGWLHPIEAFRFGNWRPTPANTLHIKKRKPKKS